MARHVIPAGASFTFDTGVRRLAEQSKRLDALDNKAAVVIAIDGVLAGFLMGDFNERLAAAPIVGIVTTAALAISLVTALSAFWTRRYESAPAVEALARMMNRDSEWLQWRFLGNVLGAIATNRQKLDQKARLLTTSLVALLVHAGLLGGYLGWLFGSAVAKGL